MSDLYIQGETLQVGKKFDSAIIEGINETFDTMKPKLFITQGGGTPSPSGGTGMQIKNIDDHAIKSSYTINSYIESAEVN